AGALAGLAGAALLWAVAVPHYRASAVIAPANPMNGAHMASAMEHDQRFAPLNFLLQRVGGANAPDFVRFEAMARGPGMAEALLANKTVLQGLARDKAYFWSQPPQSWNAAQFAEYLERRVEITPMPGSALRVMKYAHPDARFAAFLLSEIHRQTDAAIRRKTRGETLGRIAYLQAELGKAMNPEHRRALTDLLLEQERLNMLVSIDQPYAADLIESPSPSSRPRWPDIPMAACLMVLAGMLAGFAVFGLRRA
ncbi:MAG TPA: hypothetical protein PLO23_07980, partial [Alphaproteobacteria bacterium]|nr:hypothetical protein [Alphaproteobacteria bacterium]